MSDHIKSPMLTPLPKNHWLYEKDAYGMSLPPAMGMRVGAEHPLRLFMDKPLREAARHALRATSSCGTNEDLDPDALVRNVSIGLFGYNTATGLHSDAEANPPSTGDGQLMMLEIIRACLLSGDLKPQQLQDILDTHRMVHGS